jgi:biopolymer transport protein ExbD
MSAALMSEEALSPAQRAKIRRLAVPVEPQPGDEAGELNVVPYLDIIMNIMMFVLASVSVAFASTVPAQAAPINPGIVRPIQALRLTALITAQGVALKTASSSIGPGCEGLGLGVTVPNRNGATDLAGLSACARKIKDSSPEAAKETQVTLAASPDVPYQTVIAVMDGLRADEQGPLFPDVSLGAVR